MLLDDVISRCRRVTASASREGGLRRGHSAIKLPDDTAAAVRTDGRSGVNELLQCLEGTTIQGLSVRFIVDAPAAGQYAFIVRGPYGPDRAMVEGEVTFDVAAP